MATVETIYLGELRTEATHVQSGSKILTDAPTDNHGKGEAFSPTDLVAAALGSCMMTLMGIAARTQGVDIVGTRLSITKVMSADRHTFSGRDGSESAHRTGTGGGYLPGSPLAASRLQANGPLSLRRISLCRQRRHVAENHRTARHRAMRVIVVSL